MRFLSVFTVLSVLTSSLQGAMLPFPVLQRVSILENGRFWHESRRNPAYFNVEILSDNEGVKVESLRHGKPFVTAEPGERYSVRVFNPLPVRVAVNLTVDGLNSLTGKPSGIADGAKWLIEPYQSIVIRGWQVGTDNMRRFYFTDKPGSYAQWRGEVFKKDLAANCGVIGAAFFWSQKELNAYWDAHPEVRYTYPQPYSRQFERRAEVSNLAGVGAAAGSLSSARAASPMLDQSIGAKKSFREFQAQEKEQLAGTGMGEHEANPTTLVNFDFDTGMYKAREAVTIYYDFVLLPAPDPFPGMDYAPEQPLAD